MKPGCFTLVSLFVVALFLVTFSFAEPAATQPASTYPLTTCIQSGDALGADVVIEHIDGREVRFCCKDCIADFKAGGEESQKKLDDAIIAANKDKYPLDHCLVSGEKFGGDMGEPVYLVDRTTNTMFKLCCKSCVKKIKADPAKYVAKLAEESKQK